MQKTVNSTCQALAESQTGAGGARFYQPPLSYTPMQFCVTIHYIIIHYITLHCIKLHYKTIHNTLQNQNCGLFCSNIAHSKDLCGLDSSREQLLLGSRTLQQKMKKSNQQTKTKAQLQSFFTESSLWFASTVRQQLTNSSKNSVFVFWRDKTRPANEKWLFRHEPSASFTMKLNHNACLLFSIIMFFKSHEWLPYFFHWKIFPLLASCNFSSY